MRRATLLLDDELYRKAKLLSKERGTSLKEVINSLIRDGLQRAALAEAPKKLEIPLRRGLKPAQGIDPADRNTLYEIMEGRIKR